MPAFTLTYGISRRTPPTPKAWRAIEELQAELNRRCTWRHERLALAQDRQSSRPPFGIPLFSPAPARPYFGAAPARESDVAVAPRILEAWAQGSTKVRDDLWSGHLVTAFLRRASAQHPDLLLELRDDGGFVQAGAVTIKNGKVELQREWLNRARERALETTGDPNAAAPYVWAEHEALEGRYFLDAPANDFMDVPEIRELDVEWDQLSSMMISDVAEVVVDHVASTLSPARG